MLASIKNIENAFDFADKALSSALAHRIQVSHLNYLNANSESSAHISTRIWRHDGRNKRLLRGIEHDIYDYKIAYSIATLLYLASGTTSMIPYWRSDLIQLKNSFEISVVVQTLVKPDSEISCCSNVVNHIVSWIPGHREPSCSSATPN